MAAVPKGTKHLVIVVGILSGLGILRYPKGVAIFLEGMLIGLTLLHVSVSPPLLASLCAVALAWPRPT